MLEIRHPSFATDGDPSPEKVERNPQVMNDFAPDRGPSQKIRFLGDVDNVPANLRCIRVLFFLDTICVCLEKRADFDIQLIGVFLGAVKLDRTTGRPVGGPRHQP